MRAGRWRAPVLAGLVLAALCAPLATGATGDSLREGVRNGTASRETEIIGDVARSTGPKGGYVTRQSNVSTGAEAGGAAIYGCRTEFTSTEPCLRASNRAGGRAFEFATLGELGGRIEVGSSGGPSTPNEGARPFTTNATGVATGLNADRVDGFDAEELRGVPGPAGPAGAPGPPGPAGSDGAAATRLFALYDTTEDPKLVRSSGVVTTRRFTPSGSSGVVVAVVFDRDVSGCVPVATRYATSGGWRENEYAVVQQSASAPDEVRVALVDRDLSGVYPDGGFSLAVFC